MPVEPVGSLADRGWLPGTWVKYSTESLSFLKAISAVDLSDGTGILAGFLMTGPQHVQQMESLSDMWSTDSIQRDGGDTKADFGGSDAGAAWEVDENLQIKRMGSRVVTMVIPPTGYWKSYVFETNDLDERTLPGSGSALSYVVGEKLYVSNRGRLTSEKESESHTWTGYVIAAQGLDDEGSFLYTVAASG